MAKGNTTFNLLFKSNGQSVLQELSANLADVESAVKAVTESAKGLEKPMSKLYTNAMGAVAINDLIGQAKSAVDGLAQSWQEFDEGMRKVNTMAGLGRDGLKQLIVQVEELRTGVERGNRSAGQNTDHSKKRCDIV